MSSWIKEKRSVCTLVIFVVTVLSLLKVAQGNKDPCSQLNMPPTIRLIAVSSISNGTTAELINIAVVTEASSMSSTTRLVVEKTITKNTCRNLVTSHQNDICLNGSGVASSWKVVGLRPE